MAKSIPTVSAMIVDFDSLASRSDDEIINRFLFYSRNSRKRIFAKSVRYNACKVERTTMSLTIRLLDSAGSSDPQTTAFFSFIPPPNFSQRYAGT